MTHFMPASRDMAFAFMRSAYRRNVLYRPARPTTIRGIRSTQVRVNDSGDPELVYHETAVIVWRVGSLVLNSGGWRTVVTKRRINDALSNSHAFNRFRVYQSQGDWYLWHIDSDTNIPFCDGMEIGIMPTGFVVFHGDSVTDCRYWSTFSRWVVTTRTVSVKSLYFPVYLARSKRYTGVPVEIRGIGYNPEYTYSAGKYHYGAICNTGYVLHSEQYIPCLHSVMLPPTSGEASNSPFEVTEWWMLA